MKALRNLLCGLALGMAGLVSLVDLSPAIAQGTPCQWNYAMVGNQAVASYCGIVTSNGGVTITGVADIPTMQNLPSPTANQTVDVTNSQGGIFTWVVGSLPCNSVTGGGDGGTTFCGKVGSTYLTTGYWKRQYDPSFFYATWFGAKFDGVTDDTAAITSALTAAYNSGPGATVNMPAGTACVSTIAWNWAGAFSVNLRGSGMTATTLKKCGATTTPIIDLTAGAVFGVFSTWSDFAMLGNAKSSDCLRMTITPSITLRNIQATACNNGFNAQGIVAGSFYNLLSNNNNVGYMQRKSGTVYSNLNLFIGGVFDANSSWGMDLGEGNGTLLLGTDLEVNGTAANLNTGAVIIRNTVDDETGFATINLNNTHMESNHGTTLFVEAATGLNLAVDNGALILAPEAGHAATVGNIAKLTLANFQAVGNTATFTVAGQSTIFSNVSIDSIADTSTARVYTSVSTGSGTVPQGGNQTVTCTLVAGGCTITFPVQPGQTFGCNIDFVGGTPGFLYVDAITPGTSFHVKSSSGADTSFVTCHASVPN